MTDIHATAIIHKDAVIGEGTRVGPYSVIGPHVVLGKGNVVASHVVIEGHTTIGDENHFFQFASVGAAPQDLKYHGEASRLVIGNKNIVREYVTLQPGTEGGGMLTSIGNRNLFMANVHVGHDGKIGDSNVFANSAALAGHVIVGNGTTVGGLSGIHQFVRLGDLCILGAGSMVAKDIPPYCMAQGDRAGLVGINVIGLQRKKFSQEAVAQVRKLYRELFVATGPFKERIARARAESAGFAEGNAFIDFIANSERGVAAPRKRGAEDAE